MPETTSCNHDTFFKRPIKVAIHDNHNYYFCSRSVLHCIIHDRPYCLLQELQDSMKYM